MIRMLKIKILPENVLHHGGYEYFKQILASHWKCLPKSVKVNVHLIGCTFLVVFITKDASLKLLKLDFPKKADEEGEFELELSRQSINEVIWQCDQFAYLRNDPEYIKYSTQASQKETSQSSSSGHPDELAEDFNSAMKLDPSGSSGLNDTAPAEDGNRAEQDD